MKRRTFLKWCLALPILPSIPIQKNDYIPAILNKDEYVVLHSHGLISSNTTLKAFNYDDIYISPEALEDIRNWGSDIIDETTRKELFQQYV